METTRNEHLPGDLFSRFRFHNGKTNKYTQVFFGTCFRTEHVGNAQATTASHDYKKNNKIPEILLRFCFKFRNPTEKIPNPGFCLFFACNTESIKCRFSKCCFSLELEKLEKYSRWRAVSKINPKSLGPAFSLCRRARIDAVLVRAQFCLRKRTHHQK